MTKAERQANSERQKRERALQSLMATTEGGAEEDDVEDISDEEIDDFNSFLGQFMVKIEWKLDIFRLPVFPVRMGEQGVFPGLTIHPQSDRIDAVLARAAKHVGAAPASVQLLLEGDPLRRDQTIGAKGVTITSILELRAVAAGGKRDGDGGDAGELDDDQVRIFFKMTG